MVKIKIEGEPGQVKAAEEEIFRSFRVEKKSTTYPIKGTGFMRVTLDATLKPKKKYSTAPADPDKEPPKKREVKVIEISEPDAEDKRYAIVDKDTGEVLDDCKGYGFKSPEKAMAKWNYEHRGLS